MKETTHSFWLEREPVAIPIYTKEKKRKRAPQLSWPTSQQSWEQPGRGESQSWVKTEAEREGRKKEKDRERERERKNRFFFFKIYLFLIDWWLVYNIDLISVIHQHELTIGVHMSPPSRSSLPPPRFLMELLLEYASNLRNCKTTPPHKAYLKTQLESVHMLSTLEQTVLN